jgi:hypothetical protein
MLDAAIVVEELYAADPSTALTILGTGLGLTPLIQRAAREIIDAIHKKGRRETGIFRA